MHMLDLRRLRYLVVLAKRLSYSRAAEDLGLSQSALSRAIQSLETELGVRLFDRDRAGVLLTEQGRWIVEKAENLLTSAIDLEHQIQVAAKGAEGRTRFGISALPAAALLPALAERLRDLPEFAHEVVVADVEPLWIQLAHGEIECMISSEWQSAWPIPDGMPVRKESLGHFPVSIVVRKNHPLSLQPDVQAKFPVLITNRIGLSSQPALVLRERFGCSLQSIGDLASARALVKQSDALWLTSSFAVADDLLAGAMVELPLPPDIEAVPFEIFVYSLARRSKSVAITDIEAMFRRHMRMLEKTLCMP